MTGRWITPLQDEPFAEFGIPREFVVEDFQGVHAPKRDVPDLVDGSHPAFADELKYFPFADTPSCFEKCHAGACLQ